MERGELNCADCFGTLVVHNANLHNGWAWCAYDLTALLDEAEIRGGDRLIPHTTGTLARRRRRTVTRKDFPVVITGLYSPSGVRQTDTAMGLIQNVEILKASLGIGEDAPAGTAGTVTATWTRADATVRTAAVHVIALRHTLPAVRPHIAQAVLSLSLPNGRFT